MTFHSQVTLMKTTIKNVKPQLTIKEKEKTFVRENTPHLHHHKRPEPPSLKSTSYIVPKLSIWRELILSPHTSLRATNHSITKLNGHKPESI